MNIKDFFELYNKGDVYNNQTESPMYSKLLILNKEPQETKVDCEVVSLFDIYKNHIRRVRMSVCKPLNYRCKEYTNEAACIYNMFSEYEKKIKKTKSFYYYEMVRDKKGNPVGIVVEKPENNKKYYYFYFLDDFVFNLNSKDLSGAVKRANIIKDGYMAEMNDFVANSKSTEVIPKH